MNAGTITLDGYRHRYYAATVPNSPYPPVVALHGFGIDGYWTFHKVAKPLCKRNITLYALDLLGFGASETPKHVYSLRHYAALVTAFTAALNLPPSILMGHSMGGKIAAASLVLHPDAFDRLLLVNPGGFSWMAPWLPVIASARCTNQLLRQRWIHRHILPHLPLGRLLTRPAHVEQALRLRHSHYALDLDATGLRSRLRSIQQPVGVIWGYRDAYLPASTLDRIRNDLPQALVYRLPHAGHFPMWNAPDAFADVVHRFAERIA